MRIPRIFLTFLCYFCTLSLTHAATQCLRWDLNQACIGISLTRIEWRVRCSGGTPAVGMPICASNTPPFVSGSPTIGNSLYANELELSPDNRQCYCRMLAPELSQYATYVRTFMHASECEAACSTTCLSAIEANANGRARWSILSIDSLNQ